jgi:paraquat-inducible protein B
MIPLAKLAALAYLLITVQRILSEGPTITIVFKAAEGVEAGNTFVKYKDVNIGQVKTVKLSSDYTKVVVTAKIDKSAEGLIVEDAEFWVEQPGLLWRSSRSCPCWLAELRLRHLPRSWN